MSTPVNILLTRDAFRAAVFARDGGRCVLCSRPAQDAHHILGRRLWPDGGYYLSNGASLCGEHHLKAETTEISVEDLRAACGITKAILPPHLYDDQVYDKWGNIVLPSGQRLRGELFFDESVQKVLAEVLHLFTEKVKYPRTHHVPWSEGMHDDDRMIDSMDAFVGQRVIVSEKKDGENCLDENTLVETDSGIKTIKEVCESKGQLHVKSYNVDIQKCEMDLVTRKSIQDQCDNWYEIELEDGSKIQVTGDHYIWIPQLNCYRKVSELQGDECFLLDA